MAVRVRRPGRIADGVVTGLLSAASSAFALLMSGLGALLGMASDVCGDEGYHCSYGLIAGGVLTAMAAPPAVGAVAIVAVVARWRRGRLTWPIALLGAAAVVGAAQLGQVVVASGITRGP